MIEKAKLVTVCTILMSYKIRCTTKFNWVNIINKVNLQRLKQSNFIKLKHMKIKQYIEQTRKEKKLKKT